MNGLSISTRRRLYANENDVALTQLRLGCAYLNHLQLHARPAPRRAAERVQRDVRRLRVEDAIQLSAAGLHFGGHGGAGQVPGLHRRSDPFFLCGRRWAS